ncbi:LysR family transcriptional regulator [Mycolicibacterium madagascariense]|uniref:Probable hydrogen peroxide-inducible genes activator n=1 Tax=Mycolicibacterium madagascariense TaxID=212765 RepID=A0A7I7XNL2_9MYCO|nr:LysR family transcriptional regulator [Mycolicibacterium madagascariense]MCV7012673.1 LysR family transcriptional regulator [Mycolicibacterium madagascariense]BBZ30829.1 LysR family transcriptional regulator [Mycolicibacterium madagascariense]
MDLDMRKVRYFVALAEELNYRAAAERLHLAQPVLSRQIQSLERELGVRLFLRDSTGTRLTPAGEQLLKDAVPLLTDARGLQRRVAAAAQSTRSLTVGFMPGLTITFATRALSKAHPDVSVEVLRTDWTDQVTVLHDGRADVGFVRMPIDLTGLSTLSVWHEPHVAVVAAAHPVAGRDTVGIAELAADDLLQDPDTVPEWKAVRVDAEYRAPSPPARSVEEKLEWVASGRGFSVLPQSVADYYRRSDIAAVALNDVAFNEVRLAWLRDRRSPVLDSFVDVVRQHLPLEESEARFSA